MSQASRVRKLAVQGLVASLIASAAVGILAVLFGEFRETELKILGTTLTLAGASLCALPCAARLDGAGRPFLPRLGLAVAILTAAAQVAGIWEWKTLDSEAFWKSVGTGWTLSVALAHAAFLGQMRLPERFRKVGSSARIATALLAGLVVLAIWTEWDDDLAFRLIGALSILATVLTIVVPVLHRISPPSLADTVPAGAAIRVLCPVCAREMTLPPGPMRCDTCRSTFEIRILERRTA